MEDGMVYFIAQDLISALGLMLTVWMSLQATESTQWLLVGLCDAQAGPSGATASAEILVLGSLPNPFRCCC
jgi:hypothetical protein